MNNRNLFFIYCGLILLLNFGSEWLPGWLDDADWFLLLSMLILIPSSDSNPDPFLIPTSDSRQDISLMDKDQVAEWERTREKGLLSYLIIPGIVFPTLLLMLSLMMIGIYFSLAHFDNSMLTDFHKAVPFIGIATVFFGLLRLGIWISKEGTYRVSVGASLSSNRNNNVGPHQTADKLLSR